MHKSLLPVSELPRLDDPLMVASLWGWNDATGPATEAMSYLLEEWGGTEIASVDPDRFYDLTVARPRRQRIGDEFTIRWPGTRFHTARPPGTERDVIFLEGREPSLRWNEYTAVVVDVMQAVGAHRLLAVGSRPDNVPHTRPTPLVLGDATDYFERLFDRPSQDGRYEGPTGIQTVLSIHLRSLGMDTARLTALVPAYINAGPNPSAALALVEHLDRALGASTRLQPVLDEIEAFGRQADEALPQLEDAEQVRDHVRQLEELYDATAARHEPQGGLPAADELVSGVEDLLREHREDEADDGAA